MLFRALPVQYKEWFRTHRTEVSLFVLSFIVHFAMSIWLYSRNGDHVIFFQNEDAFGYVDLAKSVVAGNGFTLDSMVSALRTPVYPLFLSIFLFLHLPFTWSVLLGQNILASLASVLVYRIGNMLFSSRAALIAAVMFAVEPFALVTSNLATTETLFVTLIVVFTYTFLSALKQKQRWKFFLCGAFIGLAALTRPVAQYLPIVPLIILAVHSVYAREWRSFCIRFALVITGFLIVIAPWSIREYVHFGTTRLSTIDSFMLYVMVAPIPVMDEFGVGYIPAANMLVERLARQFPGYTVEKMKHTFAYYDYMTAETKRLIFERPVPVIRFYALSIVPTFFGTGYEYLLENVIGLQRKTERPSYTEAIVQGGFGALIDLLKKVDIFQLALFGSLIGWVSIYTIIFFVLRKKEAWQLSWSGLLLLLCMVGYFTVFTIGPASNPRFRVPSFPFWFLLLGMAIDYTYTKKKHK